jgi:amphi-Trp domain-containing protein
MEDEIWDGSQATIARCNTQRSDPSDPVGKDGGMADELIEATSETVLRREEAAARLRELADQLARHNQVEFVREGMRFSVRVPDQVKLKLELEIGEQSEIEIELSW